MKNFFKSKIGKITFISVLSVLLIAFACCSYYTYWYYQQPKFHDMKIELGDDMPEISEFFTEYAIEEKAFFAEDVNNIDISTTGEKEIHLNHGDKEEVVILSVVDTTAPEVIFKDVSADIDTTLKPEDFIESITDFSETTVEFKSPLTKPESYGSAKADIIVTDAEGNVTEGQCNIHYYWMIHEFTMELGMKLNKADILLKPDEDADLIKDSDIERINTSPVGEYTIISEDGSSKCECVVNIIDTVAPELEIKEHEIYLGENVSLEDFFVSAYDISGDVNVELITEIDTTIKGEVKVIVRATDVSGNVTEKETLLNILTDTTPPSFSGVGDLYVNKHSSPNYESGVRANDDRDGSVEFTVDSSKVNTAQAGTYYAIYKASDKSGNEATYRRKIIVNHDDADTRALIKSIAAKLPADAEAIRDYVRDNISYSYNWGGSDPIWFGFKNLHGNCYVHATCLQALLNEKGYATQLIWVTSKGHYWVLVNIGGSWKHIDATPGNNHTKYSLMNDAQRYETLQGRDWDRTKWPACD